jgi:hypothetical protein
MSPREFEDQLRRELRMGQYLRAAMGLGGAGAIRVRPMTDPFPSPRESRAWYERNKDRPPIRVADTARVRVLAVRTDLSPEGKAAGRAKAEKALARLRAGEDFVPVYREANQGSPEPDPNDGLLEIVDGRVAGSQGADWIVEFATKQPKGTVSDVIERGSTFYVLRAEGFTPAHTRSYEESHEAIQEGLGRVKRMVASYEVEISLLEAAAVTPRERYDTVREHLSSTRRRLIEEAGL